MVAEGGPPYDRSMMHRANRAASRLVAFVQSLTGEERAASMVEYVLLVALIAMVAFAAVALMGQALGSEYDSIATSVQQA